jgi:bifunctional DNA-binding transcriptional regulator/antitoxin component of YhaV-PrlF toxin-antitoxin module
MRITSKGQVTIPIHIREQAGLMPHTEVEFEFDGTAVRVRRAKVRRLPGRGDRLISQLRGGGDVPMSTDEIMALTRE